MISGEHEHKHASQVAGVHVYSLQIFTSNVDKCSSDDHIYQWLRNLTALLVLNIII